MDMVYGHLYFYLFVIYERAMLLSMGTADLWQHNTQVVCYLMGFYQNWPMHDSELVLGLPPTMKKYEIEEIEIITIVMWYWWFSARQQ